MIDRTCPRVNETAIKAFRKITTLWGLDEETARTLLGGEVPANQILTDEQFTRASYVIGIFAGLQALLSDTQRADAWVKAPNKHFDGDAPLTLMLQGPDGLEYVRRYVDYFRFC